ncbi:MAG TPA: ABC transporter permease [Stellaceae bacterium]|nr:ABC transporter permease [Stellaceae bacterium]
MRRQRIGWRFGIILALAWMVLCYLLLPLLIVVPVSFTDERYLSLPQHALSLRHYRDVFSGTFWLPSIVQSLFVCTISTIVAVTLGTLATYGCWRLSSRLANAVRALMLLPLIVPSVVHAIGFFRMWIDLDLLDSFPGVILAHIITSMPYVVITVSASLAGIDVRLEQAARSLGASLFQTLRMVILPNIMPGVLSGAVFAFVQAWDEIVVLLFITSRHVYLLSRAIWDGVNENIDPAIAAVATLMIVLTFAGLLIGRAWSARLEERSGKALGDAVARP